MVELTELCHNDHDHLAVFSLLLKVGLVTEAGSSMPHCHSS
jgi:hypothetical protein